MIIYIGNNNANSKKCVCTANPGMIVEKLKTYNMR